SLSRRAERTVSDPRLRQILQYPAVVLSTDPRRAPAIYHLMSALDLDEGVDYPMGGFRTVVDAFTRLAERAGVRIHTSAEVEAI
ncbi:phytoene desaturase, partial [Burkholderia multivorans]